MLRSLKRGFTLVELLVVIGIIALLISILMPSLSRARQSAITLQCLSNVRTIGQALLMYSNDNKGFYPYGWTFITNAGDGDQRYWPATLASYMNGASANPWDSNSNGRMSYFKCPEVSEGPAFPWTPASHYGAHPIAFPFDYWGSATINNNARLPLYKASWMAKNGSEKAIIWDAVLMLDPADSWGGVAQPVSGHVDGDMLWYGSGLIDAPGAWAPWLNVNDKIGLQGVFQDKPANRSDGKDGETFRVRHNGNTACNFLFGDGHAETRTISRSGMSRDKGNTDLTHANFTVWVGHPGITSGVFK